MNLDWIILHGLRVLTTCPLLDFWMPRITALGNSGIVWVVAAIVLLCTKKYRRYGVMLLVGLAAALLLGNLALKNLFARPRPCWLDESVPLLIARPRDYSFPSGHTMAGAIGATILTAADRRFGWAAIPLAVLIAFSRLYLYVHFPSDVLGGAVLGVGIGLLMLYGERQIAGRCKHRPLQGRDDGICAGGCSHLPAQCKKGAVEAQCHLVKQANPSIPPMQKVVQRDFFLWPLRGEHRTVRGALLGHLR